jgi:dienelactone hydrolase
LRELLAVVPPALVVEPGAMDVTWEEDRWWLDEKALLIRNTMSRWGGPTPLDRSWFEWLERTGELPPDFTRMPSLPFLPDPLVLDEGGENVPVTTREQWQQKREWIGEQARYWMTGTFPPSPDNLTARVLSEAQDGAVTRRIVELRFGPEHRARLTLVLAIPPGDGPFPVFLTQWNHQSWALLALRRGYMTCAFAGTDDKDDTESYAELWYPEYDFSRLMRRAWGAHRAIDYLYTLPYTDRERIALVGHSRNGKQALFAAMFDERIKAVVPQGCGSGVSSPWRYTADRYDCETIEMVTTVFPSWYHPRFRFFTGREHKLPIDTNSLLAMIAPRGLLLSYEMTNNIGNPWGSEQCYRSVERVYKFLGAEDKLVLRFWDRTEVDANAIELFIDFFDYVFGRSAECPPSTFPYGYSFPQWQRASGEVVDPLDYPEHEPDDPLRDADGDPITSEAGWEARKVQIQRSIRWALGDEPPGLTTPGPGQHGYLEGVLDGRQAKQYDLKVARFSEGVNVAVLQDVAQKPASTPFHSIGDHVTGHLFYPVDEDGRRAGGQYPAVVYLHAYAYSSGFRPGHRSRINESFLAPLVRRGFVVLAFDMVGFGTRILEGTRFYQRHPHWSKLGRAVADTRSAVDALLNMEFVQPEQIYLAGYALGGTVGLYAAALDERVAGVASACGITPMRFDGPGRGTEGLRAYSHLHGLLPRLGFFAGHEQRLPYDFQELLACVAPRPLYAVAPRWDLAATFAEVERGVSLARGIYDLYGAPETLRFDAPEDYGRFSEEMQRRVIEWLALMAQEKEGSHA